MQIIRRKYLGMGVVAAGLAILAALSGRIHPFFRISQGLFLAADVALLLILFMSVLLFPRNQKR